MISCRRRWLALLASPSWPRLRGCLPSLIKLGMLIRARCEAHFAVDFLIFPSGLNLSSLRATAEQDMAPKLGLNMSNLNHSRNGLFLIEQVPSQRLLFVD